MGKKSFSTNVDTHGVTITYGRYKGERFTRLPIPYLKKMVEHKMAMSRYAKAELKRRGFDADKCIDISPHSIDMASTRLLGHWKRTRRKGEGIFTWLHRIALEAIEKGNQDADGRYLHNKMKLSIKTEGVFPVLITVFYNEDLS